MADAARFRAPTGTRDVLPPESARWSAVVDLFGRRASLAGYGWALTPLFEELGVFSRAVGEATDIVTKEMYRFEDRGGREMALRPEVTASVVRAFLQHNPPTPWKVWYWGPNFRYERPQAGRYRQFYQLGAEGIGSDDPALDVEMVATAARFVADLGLRRVRVLINSLGDANCRPAYRQALVEHLEARVDQLCDEHKQRWSDNPLRVLDCKREQCRAATADAPTQLEMLCEACLEHWQAVTAGLASLGVAVEVATRLVRGLDYYTRTTFELVADSLESAQNAVGGGGRYDGLVEAMGGPPTPGIGFAMGIDRLLLACEREEVLPPAAAHVDVFIVDVVGGEEATALADELRSAGIAADRAFDQRSMKAQFRAADRSGATVALVVGQEEKDTGTVTVRPMRGGEQRQVPRQDAVDAVRSLLSTQGAPR